jgi:hypothetical protein
LRLERVLVLVADGLAEFPLTREPAGSRVGGEILGDRRATPLPEVPSDRLVVPAVVRARGAVAGLGASPRRQSRVLSAHPQLVNEGAGGLALGLPARPADQLLVGDKALQVCGRQAIGGEEPREFAVLIKRQAVAQAGDGLLELFLFHRHPGLLGERGREDPQQAAAPCRLEGTGASQPDLIQDARGQRGRGVRWAGVVVGQMACRGEHRGVLRPPAHPQRGRVGGEETTDLREHGPGIVGLLRDLAGWQPLAQRVELRGISSGRARRPDQVRPRPVLIEHRRPGPGQDAERGRGDDALAPRGVQGPADVHHCLRPGLVSVLGRSLLDGDLVVPVQDPVPECLVDPAGAAHAKARQLGGAQRPHRGAAEHVDASLHDPHDFLVPHRGNASTAIDDADDAGTGAPQAVHVPGRRWGQADRV